MDQGNPTSNVPERGKELDEITAETPYRRKQYLWTLKASRDLTRMVEVNAPSTVVKLMFVNLLKRLLMLYGPGIMGEIGKAMLGVHLEASGYCPFHNVPESFSDTGDLPRSLQGGNAPFCADCLAQVQQQESELLDDGVEN